LNHGAVGFLQKPVSAEQLQEAYTAIHEASGKRIKTVLVVEDDKALRAAVRDLLDADDVSIHEACSGEQALAVIRRDSIDLIILDLGLPDMNGFELLEKAGARDGARLPPVIVFTGSEISREEYEQLQRYSAKVVIKGVRSDERLVNEVALFLHRRVASLPERARKMLALLHDRDALFTGKKVLLVDDDIRNVFSLSGLLEERGFQIITAKNGQDALDKLAEHQAFDVLLTDIMMPIMDGYELIRRVRAQERYARLPILALTAKAMKGDRDRCMEAGASDYLSKPVDADRLLSTLRVWLYR
jgi:tubulin-specific chaperone A